MPSSFESNKYVLEWLSDVQPHHSTNGALDDAGEMAQSDPIKPTYTNSPSAKYVRKSRHKTKDDRYDYKGFDNHTVKRLKREQSDKHKRPYRKSGEELQKAFKAPNIGEERLTLKVEGAGFLKKGRSSEPMVRCELPDLTFSEMSFLKKERDHYNLYSQGLKALQRAEKDRIRNEEISEFFAQSQEHQKKRRPGEVSRGDIGQLESNRITSSDRLSEPAVSRLTRINFVTKPQLGQVQHHSQKSDKADSIDVCGAPAVTDTLPCMCLGQGTGRPISNLPTSPPNDMYYTRTEQAGMELHQSESDHPLSAMTIGTGRLYTAYELSNPLRPSHTTDSEYCNKALDQAGAAGQNYKAHNGSFCEAHYTPDNLDNLADIASRPDEESQNMRIGTRLSPDFHDERTAIRERSTCLLAANHLELENLVGRNRYPVLHKNLSQTQDSQCLETDRNVNNVRCWQDLKPHHLLPQEQASDQMPWDFNTMAAIDTVAVNNVDIPHNTNVTGFAKSTEERMNTIYNTQELFADHCSNFWPSTHEQISGPDLVFPNRLSLNTAQNSRPTKCFDAFDQSLLRGSYAESLQTAIENTENAILQKSLLDEPLMQIKNASTAAQSTVPNENVLGNADNDNQDNGDGVRRPQLLRPSLYVASEETPFNGFARPWLLYY